MKPETLFLYENGITTIINGDEISFSTPEEYKEYSGIDLSEKTYVCYQPGDKFEIDKTQPDNKIPKDLLDQIKAELNRIDEYVINKADKYFKKSDVEKKEIKKNLLNQQLQAYIYAKYDIGTQSSMQAMFTLPTTSEQKKTAIASLWAWIQSVLTYYYEKKAAIDEDFGTTWNFAQFDATNPNIILEELL